MIRFSVPCIRQNKEGSQKKAVLFNANGPGEKKIVR